MTTRYWILVAGSSEARIFSAKEKNSAWELVKEYIHPEGREKDTELVADKFGSFPNFSRGSSTFTEPTDPKEAESERFARILADELNAGRTKNAYGKLVVVAPPHFHGLLNKYCDAHVAALVTNRLEKDYTKLKEHELIPRIRELLG